MAFDTTTTNTWLTTDDQNNLSRWEEAKTFIDGMISEGKTTGEYQIVTPTVTIRYWLDLAAAEEFAAFIAANTVQHGCVAPRTVYGSRMV